MALIPLEEARRFVLDRVRPAEPVRVGLDEALGLVTAAPIVSAESVPAFANTSMDGYAVRALDTSGAGAGAAVRLEVIGSLAAGQAPSLGVGPGQAVRIMTGAPVPTGADAVVMVEQTERVGEAQVDILAPATAGQNIRLPGEDVQPGDQVVGTGTLLSPAQLGVVASVGTAEVLVHPAVRVAVLSTGDELVDVSARPGPGQIRDSNRHTLIGLLRQAGCLPIDAGLVPDREAALRAALQEAAAGADAVVTSGGVSVGDFDLVKVVLDDMAEEMRWMQVAVRPAKPFAFGLLPGGVPIFGLPGNPVSSAVSFELFVRPALRRMMGLGDAALLRASLAGRSDEELRGTGDERLSLFRVVARLDAEGSVRVSSAGGQGSHVLSAMARANALALVPGGSSVGPGDPVRVWLTGDLACGYP